MKNLWILFLFFTFTASPVIAQTKEEKKKQKEELALKEYETTKTLINSKTYNFQAEWATSQKGRRINLSTNPNNLKIENDEADIYLPYFGEVHSSSIGLSTEGGIVFEGTIENYKVEFNDKKQKAVIKFSANGKYDRFDFTLIVYKSGNSNLNVTSNIRSTIKYDGKINELKKSK